MCIRQRDELWLLPPRSWKKIFAELKAFEGKLNFITHYQIYCRHVPLVAAAITQQQLVRI